MADISAIKLPSGNTYNIKDNNALPLAGGSVTGPVSFGDSVSVDDLTAGNLVVNGGVSFTQGINSNQIIPIKTKAFTDVIGTANNWAGATFFYGSIKPTSWDTTWRIKYRINVYVPNHPNYCQIADVMVTGKQGDHRAYYSFNTIGEYYVCYYHVLYRLTSAGFTNGYGHSLGVRFYSAYAPIDTNYKRTIIVDILELDNCTFEFYDNCLAYSAIPGTGSTNYNTYTELDFVTNGLQETGDANDVNYYNRSYYGSRTTSAALYRYQFCLTKRDGTLVPVNSVNNSVATNKTLTTDTFDPFGEIFYWSSTSTYSANTNVGNGYWYRQYLADLRYSFNCGGYDTTGTLTARAPLFLVCALQSDGMAKLHSSPLSMTLPNSDDGLIYIYLGRVYEDTYPYRVVLTFNHPVYYYKNGRVRELVDTATYAETAGNASTVGGHTVGINVPSNAVFTDSTVSTLTLASGSTAGTSLSHGGKYTLTAGTKTVSFTMPSDNNTTYTFANGTNEFTVTPSGGSAQTVTVTPSIANNITGSGTANKIPKFTAANTIGNGYGVTDNSSSTAVTSSDTNLITGRTLYYAGYTKNSGTITKVTTTAGAHTAVDVSSGDVSFNVPTTAAHVGAAASSHTHGNIQNGGTLQTTDISIASGDKLVVTDSSDSNKVARTSVSFDASTATKALTKKGTFEDFQKPISKTTITLSSAGWLNSSQTMTVSGVTTSNTVIISPEPSSMDNYVDAGVKCTTQAANSLTFICKTTPSASLNVNVMIVN